jgi:hypothetical protein
MSQSLRQRLGLRAALQLFARKHRRTPYTARITGQSIARKNARRAKLQAIRGKMLLTFDWLNARLRAIGSHLAVAAGSVCLTLLLAVQPVIDERDREIAKLDALVLHHAQARARERATLTVYGPIEDIERYAASINQPRRTGSGAKRVSAP